MKHIFIINTFTINRELNDIIDKIKKACEKLNIEYSLELNGPEYGTEDILKKYKKDKCIIMAVGGDGMINRVLNKIVNTEHILGFIPYGTGNDLYRSIKIQFKEKINKCNIIKINNKFFINVACFGIDADVANNNKIMKLKWISKKQKYNTSLISTFLKYKAKDLEVRINDKIIKDKFTTIAICNGMYYGGGYNIAPSSKLNNGLLNVYIAKKMNKFNMLNLILKMKKGQHENDSKIEKYETTKLTIISKNKISCNIDGELLEAKKFKVEMYNDIDIYYNEKLISEIMGN